MYTVKNYTKMHN